MGAADRDDHNDSLIGVTMRTRRALPLVLVLAFSLSGCGAIIHGTRQDISVQSDPAGASVTTTEASTVTTPATLNLERKRSYVLTFSAPGYEPATFNLDNHLGGGVVAADILLTGLLGVVVDGLTGAWYSLKPESASVTLTRSGDGAGPETIHVRLSSARDGQVGLQSDAPGVTVRVRVR